MAKRLLNYLPIVSVLLLAQIEHPAIAAEAFCVVTDANQILFRGNCIFKQYGGNGSFSIESSSGLIAGNSSISVSIIKPGIAEVRGLTTDGINSRWGEASRSSTDTACWVGRDFSICAY